MIGSLITILIVILGLFIVSYPFLKGMFNIFRLIIPIVIIGIAVIALFVLFK